MMAVSSGVDVGGSGGKREGEGRAALHVAASVLSL
jgi:hypothetical protein